MGSCQSDLKKEGKKVYPIKHRNPIKKKKAIPKTVKKCTWDKWIGPEIGQAKCLCCEHQDIRQIDFHCGHVVSEKDGGLTNVDNLRPICAQCNLSMGTMNLYEFKRKFFTSATR